MIPKLLQRTRLRHRLLRPTANPPNPHQCRTPLLPPSKFLRHNLQHRLEEADARFPDRAVVWELNYRGTLEFLAQARSQEEERGLTVVDGWRYFIHGWSQVVAEVFDLPMDPARVTELAEAAESVR